MLSSVLSLASVRGPGQCEVCRQWSRAAGPDLVSAARPFSRSPALCDDCIERFAAPKPRCARCGLRTGLPVAACGECLRHPSPYAGTVCAVDYAFPWDRLIASFKFRSRVDLADVLAQRLYHAVRAQASPAQTPSAPPVNGVLPIPLSPRRLQERGYNQAWELARRVAAHARLPARADLLLRPLDTAHQAELTRAERQRNLRHAFMVQPQLRAWVQTRHLALVDDVMTTGATVGEATAALLRAGAASVQVWVLARTPAD